MIGAGAGIAIMYAGALEEGTAEDIFKEEAGEVRVVCGWGLQGLRGLCAPGSTGATRGGGGGREGAHEVRVAQATACCDGQHEWMLNARVGGGTDGQQHEPRAPAAGALEHAQCEGQPHGHPGRLIRPPPSTCQPLPLHLHVVLLAAASSLLTPHTLLTPSDSPSPANPQVKAHSVREAPAAGKAGVVAHSVQELRRPSGALGFAASFAR